MFNVLSDLNWLGFVVASVIGLGLAALWFVVVIATPYQVALGREGRPAAETDLVTNLGPIVCQLIVTFTSAVLLEALDIASTGDAIAFGLITGVGYLATMTFQIAINPNFPRPLYYGVLNAPFFVVSNVITALIITATR
jgi:hypothetical protein